MIVTGQEAKLKNKGLGSYLRKVAKSEAFLILTTLLGMSPSPQFLSAVAVCSP